MNITKLIVAILGISLLTGCPSTNENAEDPAADIPLGIGASPARIVIREDAGTGDIEPIRLEKAFRGPLSTTLPEVTSGLNIDVELTPTGDCPSNVTECETWSISSQSSLAGSYQFEAFRNIIQPSGETDRANTLLDVFVVPNNDGSAGIVDFSGDNLTTAVDTNGQLWSIDAQQLFSFDGSPATRFYDTRYAQQSDLPEFQNLSQVALSNKINIAITADGQVISWLKADEVVPFDEMTQLLASIQAESGARPAKLYVADSWLGSPLGLIESNLTAVLLDDGRVIVGEENSRRLVAVDTDIRPFDDGPIIIEGIDDAIDVHISGATVAILRADGTVWEISLPPARDDGDSRLIYPPEPVAGLVNIVQISGRRALRGDGQVFIFPPNRGVPSSIAPGEGLSDIAALQPTPADIATRTDGSMVYWKYDKSRQQLPPVPFSFSPAGDVGKIYRNLVTDSACGRLWRHGSPWLAAENFTEPQVVMTQPIPGFGGNQRCDNGDFSRVIYFYFNGDGAGTIGAPTGNIECDDDSGVRYCWWFGPNDGQPQFTAIPDAGSSFRDWRWDCASEEPLSAAVLQRPGTSQNVCKVTFVADGTPVTNVERRLDFRINGFGNIAIDPAPTRTEGTIAIYPDGTRVTLTTTPDDGFVFANWDQSGCTNDFNSSEITVTMDADRTCIANFIQPTGGRPPVGRIDVTPSTVVDPGEIVTFDASASTDADGTIVSWDWDFDGDTIPDASGETVTTSFQTPGINDVILTVTDNDALEGNAGVGITVRSPNTGQTFTVSVRVSGAGQVDIAPIGRTLPDDACDGEECFLFDVAAGTTITLTASPFTPAAFNGWDSADCDTRPTAEQCVIVVNSDRNATATFQ